MLSVVFREHETVNVTAVIVKILINTETISKSLALELCPLGGDVAGRSSNFD